MSRMRGRNRGTWAELGVLRKLTAQPVDLGKELRAIGLARRALHLGGETRGVDATGQGAAGMDHVAAQVERLRGGHQLQRQHLAQVPRLRPRMRRSVRASPTWNATGLWMATWRRR